MNTWRNRRAVAGLMAVLLGSISLLGQALHLLPGMGHRCCDDLACRPRQSVSLGDSGIGGSQGICPTHSCDGCCVSRSEVVSEASSGNSQRQAAAPARNPAANSPSPRSAQPRAIAAVGSALSLRSPSDCPICQFFAQAKPLPAEQCSTAAPEQANPFLGPAVAEVFQTAFRCYRTRAPPLG